MPHALAQGLAPGISPDPWAVPVLWCLLAARRLGWGGDFPLLKGQVAPCDGAFEKSLCRLECQWLQVWRMMCPWLFLCLLLRTCMDGSNKPKLDSLHPSYPFFHQHTHSREIQKLWQPMMWVESAALNVSKQTWIQISWNPISFFPKPSTSHQCPALGAIKPSGPLVMAVPSAPALWAHTEQHYGF